MKKILFLLAFGCLQFANAQMVLKHDGVQVNDGDVFTYTSNVYPAAEWKFKLYNTSTDPIFIKGKIISATNVGTPASGSDKNQFCIGPVCVPNIVAGNSYPNAPFEMEGEGENSNFDHFINYSNPATAGQPIEYVIKFYMHDASNPAIEIGSPITITYRYDTNVASVQNNSLESLGLRLNSNSISNTLDFESTTTGSIAIYDLNGKQVAQNNFNEGTNSINTASFATGMYIAMFTDNQKRTATAKFVKK